MALRLQTYPVPYPCSIRIPDYLESGKIGIRDHLKADRQDRNESGKIGIRDEDF